MDSETLKIIEISSRNDLKRFVTFPFKLYRDNPYWTPPIIKEEIDTLDPNVNPVFEEAIARYFLA